MSRALATPEAKADLRAIWEYIADDNIDAADRVLDQIEQAFDTVSDMPGTGTFGSIFSISDTGSALLCLDPRP